MKLTVCCSFLLLLMFGVTTGQNNQNIYVKPFEDVTLSSPEYQMTSPRRKVYEITTDRGYVLTAKILKDVFCEDSNSIEFEDESGLFAGKFCENDTPSLETVVTGSKMKITVHSEKNIPGVYQIQVYSDEYPEGPAPDRADFHSKCPCGVPDINSNNKIVSGERALLGELPWQALIKWRKGKKFIVFCGGTLISADYVLTAAHCMDKAIKEFILLFGIIDALDMNNPFYIEKATVHESYDEKTTHHDIALIKLKGQVRFTENIKPACLPRRIKYQDFSGESLTISGWGQNAEEGSVTKFLHKATVEGKTYLACTEKEEDVIYNQLCAFKHATDACQGDSGGPMTYKDLESKIHYVVGVVSAGKGCARPDRYGIYTRVTGYLGWIDKHTGGKICSK